MTRAGLAARPRILGILNVTPDSFSDGGNFFSVGDAVRRAMQMLADGADVIDIGGESTRPGAQPVPADEEMRRVVPVIQEIAKATHARISIDTVKADVARAALEAGASIVNDVSGMRLDPAMPSVVADAKCEVILMHSRGAVGEMASYDLANYGDDPVGEMIGELMHQVRAAEGQGVPRACITLDPGIGFSKRSEHSELVLREIHRFVDTGFPICLGVSRKRVVAEMVARACGFSREPKSVSNDERDRKTADLNVEAYRAGVRTFRVHDVAGNRAALDAARRSSTA